MIDTENVTCDTCTAPSEFVFDASDEQSRGWPRLDIGLNPFKGDFPLLSERDDLAFLDSGATAQRPACVLEAQKRFYETMNANPLRGLYSLSVEATGAIAKVRAQIAELLGAVDERGRARSKEVVFCRNTSEALNLVAKGFAPHVLSEGDEVAITVMEHHSNLIPWQQACRAAGAKLVYLYPTRTGRITDEEIAAKIGPKTKIVAAAHVSNVLGVENPIAKLSAAAHANGAYMVVDGAQSVPHMAVDVDELGADFLAFSAHKALGPMGVGVLWGRAELLDRTDPVLPPAVRARRPRVPRQRRHRPAPRMRTRGSKALLRDYERQPAARPVLPIRRGDRGDRQGPRANRRAARRRGRARSRPLQRGRVLPQHERGLKPRGQGLCPSCPERGR